MGDALLIGLSGLQAAQQALEVTSHNIANVNTPGFTEQTAELSNAQTTMDGQLTSGNGVQLQDIKRLADQLLITQLQQAQSDNGRLQQTATTLSSAQSDFNEPGANGLSAILDTLNTSLQSLSSDPGSSASASATVSQLSSFTSTLNNLGGQLAGLASDLGGGLQTALAQVNQLTSQIATLNGEIAIQVHTKGNPNDLLDQRDQLVSQLANYMELQVNPQSDGTVNIDSSGAMLVGGTNRQPLHSGTTASGGLAVLAKDGTTFAVGGGSIGAMIDLSNTVLPALIGSMDGFTSTFARAMNEAQATGTNSAAPISSMVSGNAVAGDQLDANLDASTQVQGVAGGPGIPQAYLPSFTDANGNPVARNLTINVYDPATGSAQKYILRYDPTTGDGGRSLNDLISAINTGRSAGGFSLYPPNAAGVSGVLATRVPTNGGYQLRLAAQGGQTIDFSPALDTQPAVGAWTSGATTVSGADPALANQRLEFQVQGANLQAYTVSAVDGSHIPYGAAVALGGTAAVVGGLNLTLTAGAASYNNGDTFAVDFNSQGQIQGGSGSYTATPTWTNGDATMTVAGQYTGSQTFTPATQWSMRVVSPGTIGAAAGAPVVQFTYYTGPASAPVQQTTQVALGPGYPPGTAVPIADGVYATFSAGQLSTTGNGASFTVDSQPDQAGLLSALGLNAMFTGSTMEGLAVAAPLLANPSELSVGNTRAAGDNANVANMLAVWNQNIFAGTTLNDSYQGIVSNLGVQVQQTTQAQSTQTALTTSIQNQREQTSGVSIDQQVTVLLQQQQAYSAAAKIISTQQNLNATLIAMMQ
jgi:flagellar hook-associated protein 1 FlgK